MKHRPRMDQRSSLTTLVSLQIWDIFGTYNSTSAFALMGTYPDRQLNYQSSRAVSHLNDVALGPIDSYAIHHRAALLAASSVPDIAIQRTNTCELSCD